MTLTQADLQDAQKLALLSEAALQRMRVQGMKKAMFGEKRGLWSAMVEGTLMVDAADAELSRRQPGDTP